MSAADDPERARLDAVAGVSRRPITAKYKVTKLSFGDATLTRTPASGKWETLALALTPEAAAGTQAPKATRVEFAMGYWLAQGAEFGDKDSALAAGLHPLLVEHHLLSRPSLLHGHDRGPAIEGAAMESLAELRIALRRTVEQKTACPVCVPMRPGFGATNDLLQRLLGGRASREEIFEILSSTGYGRRGATAGPTECGHAPMRVEALRKLCEAHPELALEAAQVLVPAPALDPPRFVLSPQTEKAMLGQWLMQRARRSYDDYSYSRGYGFGYGYGHRPTRRVSLRRTDGDAALSPALRGALTYASQSWGATGPLEGFVAAEGASTEAAPVMGTEPEAVDVAVLWPDGVAKLVPAAPVTEEPAPAPEEKAAPDATPKKAAPAPKKTAPAPKKAAPAPKKAAPAPKKAAPAPTEPAEAAPAEAGAATMPTPGQELMTSELRALGYGDAKVKKLLADGVIERAGFGWFRWKG